jgi:hypothetical protein
MESVGDVCRRCDGWSEYWPNRVGENNAIINIKVNWWLFIYLRI